MTQDDEESRLRSTALQNTRRILEARQRAESDLVRMHDQLAEERRDLELLNATGASLASQLDVETLVQTVTDAATKLSGAQFGAFFYTRVNPEGGVWTLFALSGAPREAFEKFGHPRDTPMFAPTFRGEPVVRIADVKKDPRYGQWAPHHGMPPGHLPVCSYLAVPVVGRAGEVLGGLFFGHSEPDVFTERAERLVVGIAAQAAIAMDNARLYEAARRDADERARLLAAEQAARAEVERVNLVKDEFLATLSHELRTPLSAVLGWASFLQSRGGHDADVQRGLETIVRNARAQAQLIEDLLDMSRIVSGKIRLDVQRLELAPLVEAAVDSVRPSLEAKQIRLRKIIDPNAGPIYGDPSRLQQIVWNLLSNAVKFTPKGGLVDVIVQRVNSHVEITVHDTGMGISLDFLPHIFERFRQADSSSKRRYGGLGLGLAIVKQLVDLHGGTIRAESPGEGQGATFVIDLPLRAVSVDASRIHPTTDRFPALQPILVSLAGTCVLVIDDEADARELMRAVLTAVGAEVLTAASADEGLDQVTHRHPDVIVSDIGMPDRDGFDLIRAVRALTAGEGGRTPAIALTAFARSEDRTRAMLAGYQVHVAKPIEPDELIATIKSLTDTLRT